MNREFKYALAGAFFMIFSVYTAVTWPYINSWADILAILQTTQKYWDGIAIFSLLLGSIGSLFGIMIYMAKS